MPYPRPNEKQDDYIARCMASEESIKSFPDQSQRAAFCYSAWRNRAKKHESGFQITVNGEKYEQNK